MSTAHLLPPSPPLSGSGTSSAYSSRPQVSAAPSGAFSTVAMTHVPIRPSRSFQARAGARLSVAPC